MYFREYKKCFHQTKSVGNKFKKTLFIAEEKTGHQALGVVKSPANSNSLATPKQLEKRRSQP